MVRTHHYNPHSHHHHFGTSHALLWHHIRAAHSHCVKFRATLASALVAVINTPRILSLLRTCALSTRISVSSHQRAVTHRRVVSEMCIITFTYSVSHCNVTGLYMITSVHSA